MNGELLMDSIGVNDNNIDSYPDIKILLIIKQKVVDGLGKSLIMIIQ